MKVWNHVRRHGARWLLNVDTKGFHLRRVVCVTERWEKGEKDYKEVLTFADGMVSMNEGQKVGFASSHYDLAKSGNKDWTFKTEQNSASNGQAVWTGTIHEQSIEGKMIMTKQDGAVLTYTFKGNKLD